MSPAYILRPAVEADFPVIRRIVSETRINPMGLDWRRFILACTLPDGKIIGCGQIKPHKDGSRELASIAVIPGWRNQGIARDIILYLIDAERLRPTGGTPRMLYLTCRKHLGSFYEKFGFSVVSPAEMPRYFRRISRLVNVVQKIFRDKDSMLVMVHALE
jgi:N-acetylglutamate synthase-like GNAT family acetyltransferase